MLAREGGEFDADELARMARENLARRNKLDLFQKAGWLKRFGGTFGFRKGYPIIACKLAATFSSR
jgi:hypothetical protein